MEIDNKTERLMLRVSLLFMSVATLLIVALVSPLVNS